MCPLGSRRVTSNRSLGALPCPNVSTGHTRLPEHRLQSQGRQCPCLGCVTVVLSQVEGWAGKVTLTPYDGDKSSGHGHRVSTQAPSHSRGSTAHTRHTG